MNLGNADAIEEGLYLMMRACDALGFADLRDDAERVLRRNFPDSAWFKGGPKRSVSWWKIWDPGW